jgi:nucleoside 2-deoxyribosyltransferase
LRIYIAAPWVDRELAIKLAERLEAKGHTITHKWWEFENKNEGQHLESYLEAYSHDYLRSCAIDDVNGVKNADKVVLLDTKKSEGKAVEQGIAIALGIPIIAVGRIGSQSMNVFHHLDNYTWVNDATELEANL